jgi:hypothetical protein
VNHTTPCPSLSPPPSTTPTPSHHPLLCPTPTSHTHHPHPPTPHLPPPPTHPSPQELKRQSWRYHKQHNAWFQRYAEPAAATEEYEQGTYVYFDYNIVHDDLQTGWCYRRKENFTFRWGAERREGGKGRG